MRNDVTIIRAPDRPRISALMVRADDRSPPTGGVSRAPRDLSFRRNAATAKGSTWWDLGDRERNRMRYARHAQKACRMPVRWPERQCILHMGANVAFLL